MKLDTFRFKLIAHLRKYRCRQCKKELDRGLRITFDARPEDEWEVMAECRYCGQDYRWELGMTQVLSQGPRHVNKEIGKDLRDKGLI